ncbi:two-component system sensor histidine kinase NtrB [Syntrophus aciditrophicus]|nr:PAS domain S-box protein [Syntrophus aciditrophicus]
MELKDILLAHRKEINVKWSIVVDKHYCEQGYRQEPFEDTLAVNLEAVDANYAVLANRDFAPLDDFIEKIARKRFAAGFDLSDVQMAFEYYRTITIPIITKELPQNKMTPALERLNNCLSYTIIKFSDYFQNLHEKALKEHAEHLELEVMKRTKELAELEAKYRVLVEEINDGYFVEKKGRIIFANHAFCDMHGYTPTEVINQPYINFVASEYVSKVTSYFEKDLNRESESEQYAYKRLHKDGSFFPTENKVKRIWYKGDYAWAGICRDITERVKMAERIRESEKLAHIGQLTTSLAHEIRNPLSSIKMSIRMLLKSMDFDGDNKKTLEIADREISHLERILTEMLDFARPVKLCFELLSINQLIYSCLEILKVTIREKEITVIEKLSKRMSPSMMDGNKIEHAIINILLNAIEVLPTGGIISIETHHRKLDHKPFISVEISDNGPGVTSEDLPYIFNPFFSKKKKGTGLGLSNVKKVVDAHGGKIAASATSKGFSISFTIPVRKDHV